jgi:hypothetical protein
MMTFKELLAKKQKAILQRWVDDALAIYSKDASKTFQREKDPFANPVGHSLRVGTQGIFEALLDGADEERTRGHLDGVIKVRAVQQVTPSQAVGFVFSLKQAVRAELNVKPGDAQFASELAKLDGEIDRIALLAFEAYVECRERLCELRVNEVKRRVSWVLDKMRQRSPDEELVQLDPK